MRLLIALVCAVTFWFAWRAGYQRGAKTVKPEVVNEIDCMVPKEHCPALKRFADEHLSVPMLGTFRVCALMNYDGETWHIAQQEAVKL